MKAITLWQPWAWLIFVILRSHNTKPIAVKRVETRSWKAPQKYIGQEIAIHAAKFQFLEHEIYNRIRCAIRSFMAVNNDYELEMAKERASTQIYYFENGQPGSMYGAVLGTVKLMACVPIEKLYGTEYDTPLERACGDWSPGRYGWILSDPVQFGTPIKARGSQGFWTWER